MRNRSLGKRLFDSCNTGFLVLLCMGTVFPFLYVLFASLSDPTELFRMRGLILYPQGFSLEAYRLVFANPMISIGYANTLFYVAFGTALNLLLTSFGAYALSRRSIMLKNPIMMLIVFTMFFSGGLIPNYLLVSELGLLDTRWALIVPGAISTYNLIIMRTSFQGIPASLEESAKIDGANDFTILFRIILPLSLPIVSVMILFYGVSHWNAWFHALIYLRNRDLYPLQLVLREILITNSTDGMTMGASDINKALVAEAIKYAAIIVATVPVLFLYPFLQKYFVKGVMIGAVKE